MKNKRGLFYDKLRCLQMSKEIFLQLNPSTVLKIEIFSLRRLLETC